MSMVGSTPAKVASLLVKILFEFYFFRELSDDMKTYVFKVEMTCEGCAKAVSNVLSKFKDQGIPEFVVDLNANTVQIETLMNVEEALEILKKTGKTVTFLEEK